MINMKRLVWTVMAVIAMAGVTANAALIHHWDFEGNAADSVGSADGTLSGNAAITTGGGGIIGEALSLDGTANTCVSVLGTPLIPTTAFTLAAWVNQTDNGSFRGVVGSQSSGNAGAFIRVDSGVPAARTLPQNGSVLLKAGSVSLNTWTHLAFTYDSTDLVSGVKLYVDGVQVAVGAATPFTDSQFFRIGSRPDSAIQYNFAGLIDDVRIYDSALTDSEIGIIASDFKADIISPQQGASISPSPVSVPLEWEIIDFNSVDPNSIFVDVWFGTDPNKTTGPGSGTYTKVVDAGEETTTYLAENLTAGTYYWQVDCYRGDPAVTGDSPIEGLVYSFDVVADAPPTVEMLTNPTMTWSGQGVPLEATVTDDGGSAVTIVWTADAVSAADPNLVIGITGGDTETPTVTITKVADGLGVKTVTMTVSVTDENNPTPATATVGIDVYDDACDMTVNGVGIPITQTDYNADCVTDLQDLAIMAAAWLDDYAENGPVEKP